MSQSSNVDKLGTLFGVGEGLVLPIDYHPEYNKYVTF